MSSARELLLERAGQLVASAPVPSPCISVCRMDAASGLCEGCFRTLEEITEWGTASEQERRALWDLLVRRALTPTLARREREQGLRGAQEP
jgi:predicted Fe-S protein YdhL (DUF1289 family)